MLFDHLVLPSFSSAHSQHSTDVGKGYVLFCSFATGKMTQVAHCWGKLGSCDTSEMTWPRWFFDVKRDRPTRKPSEVRSFQSEADVVDLMCTCLHAFGKLMVIADEPGLYGPGVIWCVCTSHVTWNSVAIADVLELYGQPQVLLLTFHLLKARAVTVCARLAGLSSPQRSTGLQACTTLPLGFT